MRFILKLLAILVLTVTVQITYEVALTIHGYPTELDAEYFGPKQTATLAMVEQRFSKLNPVSRWIVADLFHIPINGGMPQPLAFLSH